MIRFFFEYNDLVIQLPVNPAELVISGAGGNKTTEIVKLGEINLIRQTKLREIKITSFLPINADAPYVLTSGRFEGPKFYIDFFEKIRSDKMPCRLIISDTDINMMVSIEKLEYGLKAQDDDTGYTMELKEYRNYGTKEIQINPDNTTGTVPPTTQPPTGFAIGDIVVVNGKGWYNSYGASPSITFTNFTGKISHIVADKSRAYRYHIQTTDGRNRGWVKVTQIKHKS